MGRYNTRQAKKEWSADGKETNSTISSLRNFSEPLKLEHSDMGRLKRGKEYAASWNNLASRAETAKKQERRREDTFSRSGSAAARIREQRVRVSWLTATEICGRISHMVQNASAASYTHPTSSPHPHPTKSSYLPTLIPIPPKNGLSKHKLTLPVRKQQYIANGC